MDSADPSLPPGATHFTAVCAGGKVGNKGADAALAALELVSLRAVLGS